MIYVRNDSTNPHFNLASEEYVFNCMDRGEEYFLLWQNEPSIIIGKHQNTIEEINRDFVKENNIHVVRRLSGGGAVYHDLGNLNFTFIVKNQESSQFDFKKFTAPVIEALKKLDVDAEFNSRNDLAIEGKKFSGNAQYMKKDRLLHHGTLLFRSDLDNLVKALNVSDDKILSKSIKSVRSRVTNIYDYLHTAMTIDEFKELLLKLLFEEDTNMKEYTLTEQDIKEINRIMKERYSTWDWNYGKSPKFNIKKEKRFDYGKVETLIDVENGTIKSLRIYGDFFGNGDLTDIENKLVGYKYEETEIKGILESIDVQHYFSNISMEQLLSVLI